MRFSRQRVQILFDRAHGFQRWHDQSPFVFFFVPDFGELPIKFNLTGSDCNDFRNAHTNRQAQANERVIADILNRGK